jgi:TetR/AcrR family transcriptional regulator, repressor for neighboring sulfatase
MRARKEIRRARRAARAQAADAGGGRARRGARTRRAPEVSRQLLLDAAERLFATTNPDEVGLKDVAREAGVSHALITHYFGTYAGLVQATLERRLGALRERVRGRLEETGALERPEELLGVLFDALADPVHLRLLKWVSATEREAAVHAFALQQRGLSVVAHHVAKAVRKSPTLEQVSTIEVALVTAVAAAMGYAVSKTALAGAIGRDPTPVLDDAVRRTLAAMLQSYLRDAIGVPT